MTWQHRFTPEERAAVTAAAAVRRESATKRGIVQQVPGTDQERADLVGLAGEWAFYRRVLGLDWMEPGWCANDVTIGDVRVDVKTTWRPDGNLLVLPNNSAQGQCDLYVLVRVDCAITEATMVGWQWASEVRKAEYLTLLRSWVFLYPADKLQSMASLLEVG